MWVRIRVQMQVRLEALVSNHGASAVWLQIHLLVRVQVLRENLGILDGQLEQLRNCP
jgi:hypothetical protein